MIEKIAIRNYRRFRSFDLDFLPGLNTVVGPNASGKSTLIEAITLALSGRLNGRAFTQELSPYLVNLEAAREYISALHGGLRPPLPTISIDLFLRATDDTQFLRGSNNALGEDSCGVRMQAKFSSDYLAEYESLVSDPTSIQLVPTEYYRVEWLGFSGNAVSARSVPAAASVIDAASMRLSSGVDYHLQQILRTHLEPRERVELSRQYRTLREEFGAKEAVKAINRKLQEESELPTDRALSLAIDISSGYTWENNLTAHIDELPFSLAGKGDQNSLKTLLAIGNRAHDAQVILLEEPETHLDFAALRKLLALIAHRCQGKQLIVATHSTFVLNKLGLDALILLGEGAPTRLTELSPLTVEYFKKLAGYETLRLVLAKEVILVEGPSDELIVQRGYKDLHGRLPADDGIDVISVGLSHKRFLELAIKLKRKVRIVTDNDRKSLEQVRARFADYTAHPFVTLHVSNDPSLWTLELCVAAANSLEVLNEVLNSKFMSKEEAIDAMLLDKTGTALRVFEHERSIVLPEYLRNAIAG